MSIADAKSSRRRILVMRYRFIGDTLLMVPFLRNLRRACPDAVIDVLVAPNSGEVLRDCPYINELIMFDTTRKHRYENPTENSSGKGRRQSFWSYVKLLRARKYDTVFVLKRSFSSAALAWLAGIPERIGFNTEGRGFLLTQRVPYRSGVHETDCFLDVLQAAKIPVTDRHLESWWQSAEEERALNRMPDENGRHVVLHLTSSNPAKQWPQTHAQRLAEWLLNQPDVHVHALGAACDAPRYEQLKQTLPDALQTKFHLHCGQLDLLSSMALLKKMSLVVGVDSGTLHMAAAVGTPVIALFGPMDEKRWTPPGATVLTEPLACRPCNLARPCRFEFQCMTDLQPERVIEQVRTHAGFA